jgi:hypothetical protein
MPGLKYYSGKVYGINEKYPVSAQKNKPSGPAILNLLLLVEVEKQIEYLCVPLVSEKIKILL